MDHRPGGRVDLTGAFPETLDDGIPGLTGDVNNLRIDVLVHNGSPARAHDDRARRPGAPRLTPHLKGPTQRSHGLLRQAGKS
jgi:hypothetical protein